jgi:hypothetical protein
MRSARWRASSYDKPRFSIEAAIQLAVLMGELDPA